MLVTVVLVIYMYDRSQATMHSIDKGKPLMLTKYLLFIWLEDFIEINKIKKTLYTQLQNTLIT